MRKAVSLLVASSLILSPFSVFAQDAELPTANATPETEKTITLDSASLSTGSTTPTLNAPSNTTAVTATSTSLGEYKEVSCSSDAIFGQHTCDQCFTGKAVKTGERLTGLFDNWTNKTGNLLIAVKDEQKVPSMVSVGSVWTPTSADESKMWISAPEIAWIPGASGKDEFTLMSGQEVKFMQTDLGAGYTLTSSSKKNGEVIGLLKFPVTYYTMDVNTATRSTTSETHYECVTYTLDAPATPEKTTPTPEKKPTPKPEQTKVTSGPAETLVLIVAAFFIAFGLMLSLRKRN